MSEKCKKISEKKDFFLNLFIYSKEVIYKYNAIICQEKKTTNDKLFAGEEEGEVDDVL
jgi:hypothetical protein